MNGGGSQSGGQRDSGGGQGDRGHDDERGLDEVAGPALPDSVLAGAVMRGLYLGAGAAAAAATLLRGAFAGGDEADKARQRRGLWPSRRRPGPWVWLHAASVGEADLALALARGLQRRRPGLAFVVSSMTATGRARVQGGGIAESRYFPIDYPRFVRRILKQEPPRLFVSIETEIWPETLRILQAAGVPTAVANARLSDRSLPRYRALRPFLGPLLGGLARVCARDEESARRWVAIGARDAVVEVAGNLKFDLALAAEDMDFKPLFVVEASSPLLLAASTHEGEEAFALAAFAKVRAQGAGPRLLVAPRHPERAESVLEQARAAGLRAKAWSALGDATLPRAWPEETDVVLFDRLGLLRAAYASAASAFVGGSVVAGPGGHNLLEPLVAGCPVVTGALLGNVEDQATLLREAGALQQVLDVDGLARFWLQVLADPDIFRGRTMAARRLLAGRLGALDRTVAALGALLGGEGGEGGEGDEGGGGRGQSR